MSGQHKHLLELVSGLAAADQREVTAREVARAVGAEDLMIYVADPELGTALPASGFPQTVPGGLQWRKFVTLSRTAPQTGRLPWKGQEMHALGSADRQGNVLVVLGGSPDMEAVEQIVALLPLLAAAFDRERIQLSARGSATLAAQSERESRVLTTSLDKAREALRKALSDARAAISAKDHFLASLSHELRTPLTPVLLLANAMEADPHLPAPFKESLATIRRNVELEVHLIDDLLDLSRIESGKLRLQMETVDFNSAVVESIENCRVQLEEKGLRLVTGLDPRVQAIAADPTKVRQVLWNLVNNAVKFTPRGGVITVQTHRPAAGTVEVSVQDTGIGVAPEMLPLVFLPFAQASSSKISPADGLGLGLAICKAIVEGHGGVISAHSHGLGLGAVFRVELPVGDLDPTPQPRPDNRSAGADTVTARVLILEDSADTAQALSRLLMQDGHTVTICGTISSAMGAFASQSFDLLLSDLGLPDGSGHDFMRTVARQYHTPGIAMSGYGTVADIAASRAAGFTEHLVKPMRLDHLKSVIQSVLQQPRSDRAFAG